MKLLLTVAMLVFLTGCVVRYYGDDYPRRGDRRYYSQDYDSHHDHGWYRHQRY